MLMLIKCFDLLAYDMGCTRGELAGCPVSQSVKLLSVGRSPSQGCCPVSIEVCALRPKWMMIQSQD